jgi:outer membrane protein TolC
MSVQVLANDSMSEAWNALRMQNEGLLASRSQLRAEEFDVDNALAARLPSIELSGRFNSLDDDIGLWFDTSVLMPGGQPIYIPIQDQSFWQAQLTMQLPLYTGGAISAGIDAEKADVASVQAQVQQTEDELFTTFVERFLSVDLAQQSLSIHQQSLNNLEQHFQRAVRMFEEGTISLTEKLQSQVERDKANRSFQQAQVDAQLAMSAYQALFPQKSETPTLKLSYQPLVLDDVEHIQHQAHDRSPILQQITAGNVKANAGIDATRAKFLPKVAAFAQYELIPDDLTQTDPEWAAGIAFEWQVFGGGNRRVQTLRYEELVTATEHQFQQAQQNIRVLVEQSISEIESAENYYLSTLSSQELAEENLRLQTKAFDQGLNTSLDKIDAQFLVTGLQLEAHKALYDYYLAYAHLCALIGEPDTFLNLMAGL